MAPPKRRKSVETDNKNKKNCLDSDKPSTSNELDDWRQKAVNLKQRMQHALKEDHLTDVTFRVGPEEQIFHAHKIILSLASPVFEAMLHGSLKETGETISIPDIKPVGFQFLIEFIYTDELNLTNEMDALAAWIVADKYCLNHMKSQCYKFLSDCYLTNQNVWFLLEHYLFLEIPALADRCFAYLKMHISDALKAPTFLEVSPETLKKILLIPSMCVKEITLLRSIVKWAEEREDSEKSFYDTLKPFLQYIHFSCLSQIEFLDFMGDHPGIISDADSLQFIKHMTNPTKFPLPEWCCHDVHSRISRAERQQLSSMKQNRKNIFSYALKPKGVRKTNASESNADDNANEQFLLSDIEMAPRNELLEIITDSDISLTSSDGSSDSDGEFYHEEFRNIPEPNLDFLTTSSSSSSSSSS